MGVTADSVIVDLKANVDGYDTKINASAANSERAFGRIGKSANLAEREIGESSKAIENNFSTLEARIKRLVELFALEKAREFFDRALEGTAALKNLAAQAGVSTDALQELRYAAQQNGVSNSQLDEGLTRLTDNLGKAQLGSKELGRVFRDGLHLDPKQFKDASDAIGPIATKLAGIPDPAKRAAIEVALFGRSGQELDSLLTQGAGGINKLRQAAHDLGIVLSGETINQAEEAEKKFSALKEVLSADLSNVIANNAQAIVSMAQALGTLTGEIIKFLGAHPQLAATIIGAIAGGLAAGPVGAVVGAASAYELEGHLAQNAVDQSNDPNVRLRELQAAKSDYLQKLAQRRTSGIDRTTAAFANPFGGTTDADIQAGTSPVSDADVGRAKRKFLEEVARSHRAAVAIRQAAVKTPPRTGPQPDSNLFGDHSAHKGEDLVKQADERTKQFNDRLAAEQVAYLAALAKNTGTEEDKSAAELAQIDAEQAKFKQQTADQEAINLRAKGVDKALEDKRAAQLIEANRQLEDEKRKTVAIEKQVAAIDKQNAIADAELQAQQIYLNAALALATNAKDRRVIELRLLELAKQDERQKLTEISQSGDTKSPYYNPKVTDAQRAGAQTQLETLDARYKAQASNIDLSTQGPLAEFMRTLPKSADDVNEAFQRAAAQGIGSLNDGIASAIANGKSLGDIFHQVSLQMIQDLIKIGLQAAETQLFGGGQQGGGGIGGLLGGLLGGGGGGGGGFTPFSGDFASIGFNDSLVPTLGFASGGGFTVGGAGGVDRNMLSINGSPVARVSKGEAVSIVPPGARRSMRASPRSGGPVIVQQTLNIDASNSVNPDGFERRILAQANDHANRAAATAGQTAYRAAPQAIQRQQVLGTT